MSDFKPKTLDEAKAHLEELRASGRLRIYGVECAELRVQRCLAKRRERGRGK